MSEPLKYLGSNKLDKLKNTKKILVTGTSGFIGYEILKKLSLNYNLISLSRKKIPQLSDDVVQLNVDITDAENLGEMLQRKTPDLLIHCAGIAGQSLAKPMQNKLCDQVNHIATANLANAFGKVNPNLHFIFLSSVDVYGGKRRRMLDENDDCSPVSSYGKSKLAAERGLNELFDKGIIQKLDILRLAPVYSCDRKLNLEKRVCSPRNWCYLKYGSGKQKVSVLSIRNLVDFILYQIQADSPERTCRTINVTDLNPCTFNEIIRILSSEDGRKKQPTFKIPLTVLKLCSLIASWGIPRKRTWLDSLYDKLAKDMVFDNRKMLRTGFVPEHTLASTFEEKEK